MDININDLVIPPVDFSQVQWTHWIVYREDTGDVVDSSHPLPIYLCNWAGEGPCPRCVEDDARDWVDC